MLIFQRFKKRIIAALIAIASVAAVIVLLESRRDSAYDCYRKVTAGMTEGEVRAFLGAPQTERPKGEKRPWAVKESWGLTSDWYWKRWYFGDGEIAVTFDKNGTAVGASFIEFWGPGKESMVSSFLRSIGL
ncbi:MAG TPA: hypothetical protein VE988_01905 [Gemmataceae bacterium]|nr:hypothetical protein [Gemmataceae bacterium]